MSAIQKTTSSTWAQQITVAQERLRPAGEEHLVKIIKGLRTCGLGFPQGIEAENAIKVYSYALEGFSHDALQTVARKLTKGEYPDPKPFIPSPPEFAALVRAEVSKLQDDLARAKLSHESAALAKGTANDPEARARVRDRLEKFRADRDAFKAADRGLITADSQERIEMWSKIMALPDAKDFGFEQAQYRDAVRSKLSAIDAREAAE